MSADDHKDVINPHHYTRFKIQPIDFIESNRLPYSVGNVIKYVCRYDAKDGIRDLYKARHYLDHMIARAEGEEGCAGISAMEEET